MSPTRYPSRKTTLRTVKKDRARPQQTTAPEYAPLKEHKTGLSLGIKYALFTASTVVIATIILVIISHSAVRKVVSDDIDDAGIQLVKVISAIDFNYWNEIQNQPLGTFIKNKGDEIVEHLQGKITETDLKVVMGKLNAILTKQTETFGHDPLEHLASPEGKRMGIASPSILNLVITNEKRHFIAGINEAKIEIKNVRLIKHTSDKIEIKEGQYVEPSSGIQHRTRLYTKPIISPDQNKKGYVQLFLSAARIDETLNSLLGIFILPALIAIIIGAAVGFWMASRVTKPLQTLVSDMESVSAGNLEHQTKVATTDEIGILAYTFNQMTDRLKTAREKELVSKALEHELKIASEIQNDLLPKKIPRIAGIDLAAYYRPCKDVGGDYYDVLELPNRNMGIVVADVAGKGIPGAMIMTMTRSFLRMESERSLSPAQTLSNVNRTLSSNIRRGMFVTALYLILNLDTKKCIISSAGHNPLIIWRQATKKCGLINPDGIAMGFDKGPIFNRTIKEQTIQLHPGDHIVAYTDGVVETMNSAKQEFGNERFYQLISQLASRNSKQFIDLVIQVLDNYKKEAPQHDDITLVSLKIAT